MQFLYHFGTQPFNFLIVWSKLQSLTCLKIRFCAHPPRFVWITWFSKSILGKRFAKIGEQKRIRRIHLHRCSQAVKRTLVNSVLYPFGKSEFGEGRDGATAPF